MLKMGSRHSGLESDLTNGLILKEYRLPEEIIAEILQRLPPKDKLSCRLVCRRWNAIVFYQLLNNYNKIVNVKHTDEALPFDLLYITMYSERLRGNLLQNVNGENQFEHWKVTENGGDGWIIECPPNGCNDLPSEVKELKGLNSCFVSSFMLASKEQCINVSKDKYLSFLINKYKPHIYVSEWVTGRFDCGAKYRMSVKVKAKGGKQVSKYVTHTVAQWEDAPWKKVSFVIDYYPNNVEQIIFKHSAQDTQFWKGHFGMKMAGGVVKLLLQTSQV